MSSWTKKGKPVASGKTKKIFATKEDPTTRIVQNSNNITAHDDPAFTKQFKEKPRLATQTTCNVFRLLKACGLPVAFYEQIAEDEFLVPIVEMIPLEAVVRRVAIGSYLERHPELKREDGKPHHFHRLVTELFLKTTKSQLVKNKQVLVSGLPLIPSSDPKKKKYLDDPLIVNPFSSGMWQLVHPKKPAWAKESDLKIHAEQHSVLFPATFTLPADSPWSTATKILQRIDYLNRWAFLIIERAWAILGYDLSDWKLEFGWTPDGQIVIADVVDNDVWRLLNQQKQEKSKQVFREQGLTEEVERNYAEISAKTEFFRLPEHALVIWRGSPKDLEPEIKPIPGVKVISVVNSGHKSTSDSLKKLEEIHRDYPEGGVIICEVGMSNGLAGILAAHTSLPVVSVCATFKEFSADVFSCLRLPSNVPAATMLSSDNAVLLALNILGLTNPAAYALRQLAIEELDPNY